MIKVDKELEALKDKHKSQANFALGEVKLLLQAEDQEDLRILENLSQQSTLSRRRTLQGALLNLENLEKRFAGDVFTIEQIKELAIKYRLRFLPTKHFKGDFDVEVAAKIKQFAKDTKTSIDEHTLATKFFILGPPSAFELKDLEKPPVDPVLFYQIDSHHYRKIWKWGNDFTIFRLILGWYWKRPTNLLIGRMLMVFMPTVLLFSILFPAFISEYPIWSTVIVVVWTFILGSIVSSMKTPENERDQTWNYYTPHNWDNDNELK